MIGKVWQDGKYWPIEVPELNLMTQGKSQKDARDMLYDLIYMVTEEVDIEITGTIPDDKGVFEIYLPMHICQKILKKFS